MFEPTIFETRVFASWLSTRIHGSVRIHLLLKQLISEEIQAGTQ